MYDVGTRKSKLIETVPSKHTKYMFQLFIRKILQFDEKRIGSMWNFWAWPLFRFARRNMEWHFMIIYSFSFWVDTLWWTISSILFGTYKTTKGKSVSKIHSSELRSEWKFLLMIRLHSNYCFPNMHTRCLQIMISKCNKLFFPLAISTHSLQT